MTKFYVFIVVALLLNVLGRLTIDFQSAIFFAGSFVYFVFAFIVCFKNSKKRV